MAKEVKFNSKSLLEIKFEKDVKGYNALEVDKTLDQVINDYKVFEETNLIKSNEIAKLTQEIDKLKAEIREKDLEIVKAKNSSTKLPDSISCSQDNISLLKRIDVLERALYKKGVDPKKI